MFTLEVIKEIHNCTTQCYIHTHTSILLSMSYKVMYIVEEYFILSHVRTCLFLLTNTQCPTRNRVYEFAGVERWNGTVEWTTGLEYWSTRVSEGCGERLTARAHTAN